MALFALVIIKVIITENCPRWKNVFAQTRYPKNSLSKLQNKTFPLQFKALKPSVFTKVLFYPALSKFSQKEPRDKTITCDRHYSTRKLLCLPNHNDLAAAGQVTEKSLSPEPKPNR